jgi:hypothetical protein
MALAMTLLLLLVTIPLLLGLVGSVTRSTQGARWSRAHATVDDCARAAVAEAIHGVLASSGERGALADMDVPYDQTVQVPWTKSLVAEPAGFTVEEVRLTALRQQGYASLSTGLLQLEVELTGPRGTRRVTVLRVYTAQDQDGYVQVEVGTQDLLFERG